MPKRKRKLYSTAWSATVDVDNFQAKYQRFLHRMSLVQTKESDEKFSERFEGLKIPIGDELCEHKLREACKEWRRLKEDPNNTLTHLDFAKTFKMPNQHKLDKVWKPLRDRRACHAVKTSKLEINAWTNLRHHGRVNYIKTKVRAEDAQPEPGRLLMFHIALFHAHDSQQSGRRSGEYIFLDCHTLDDLERKVHCLGFPDRKNKKDVRDRKGFFIFEGIVYTRNKLHSHAFVEQTRNQFLADPRDPENVLYDVKVGNFDRVKISELQVRLGATNFYVHHSMCQHQIVFTNVRLSNTATDTHFVDEYPMPVYEQVLRRRKCCSCSNTLAKMMTMNDIHAETNPAYWCETCHEKFHYDSNGKKLYEEFEERSYRHD